MVRLATAAIPVTWQLHPAVHPAAARPGGTATSLLYLMPPTTVLPGIPILGQAFTRLCRACGGDGPIIDRCAGFDRQVPWCADASRRASTGAAMIPR